MGAPLSLFSRVPPPGVQPILIVRNVHHSINDTDGSIEIKVEGQGDIEEIKEDGEIGERL